MKKNLISVLCAVMLFITIIVALPLTAAAASNPYPKWQTLDGITTVRCTWYAWQQVYDNTGVSLPNFGNAVNWYNSAKNAGYSVGSIAKPQSIAVWSGGTYGHVSYVVSVNGSKMTVNEGGMTSNGAAYNGDGIYNGSVCNSTVGAVKSQYSSKILVGFIYPTESVTPSNSVSISIGSATIGNSISDNDARVYGNVTKPSSYAATKFGISIRKSSSTYWEKTFVYAAQSSHVGESSFDIWFDMVDEVGYPLTHQTSYTYQFFAVINNTDYYSPEATFTTTGSHSYSSWQTVTAASCTTAGSQKRTCACGAYETAAIPALGHSYSSTFTVDKSASCTVAGSKSKHCTRSGCTATTEITAIPATGHSYGEWEYVQSATCTANGTKKRTCGSCGNIEYGTLLSGGHNYSSTFTVDTPATCTMQGSKSKHCAWCTSKIEVTAIPATGHSYGSWQTVSAPTCTSTGSQKHVCSSCSHTEYKTVATLGHDYSSAWTIDKAASCTTAGTKSHHCSRCTARSTVTTIPANGHSWSGWTVTKKATYEETGLKVRECTVNGCSAEESSVIAKLPLDGHTHSFGEWITETAATCTQNGTQKRTCSICKSYETQEITALGHSAGEWTVEKIASCTDEGAETRTCINCHESEIHITPALGHSFGEWQTKTEATAEKEGLLERQCSNCSETETQTTPKLNGSSDTSNDSTNSSNSDSSLPDTSDKDASSTPKEDSNTTTVIIICVVALAILLSTLIVLVIKKKK